MLGPRRRGGLAPPAFPLLSFNQFRGIRLPAPSPSSSLHRIRPAPAARYARRRHFPLSRPPACGSPGLARPRGAPGSSGRASLFSLINPSPTSYFGDSCSPHRPDSIRFAPGRATSSRRAPARGRVPNRPAPPCFFFPPGRERRGGCARSARRAPLEEHGRGALGWVGRVLAKNPSCFG